MRRVLLELRIAHQLTRRQNQTIIEVGLHFLENAVQLRKVVQKRDHGQRLFMAELRQIGEKVVVEQVDKMRVAAIV